MAASSMLTIPVHLEAHPAQGIVPEVHLKEQMNSVILDLLIAGSMGMDSKKNYTGVIKGILPDGSKLFLSNGVSVTYSRTLVRVFNTGVKQMCTLPGTINCTLTIMPGYYVNVNEKNHMNYDSVTVLPFRIVVEEAARR